MARAIAHVTGTALSPGVSRNGRLYTREAIGKAVARAKDRIGAGSRPISMRSHHAAGDDSTRVVGQVTDMWQDPQTGAAKYRATIADTAAGRDIAALTDDSDGQPQYLRGVSIRGAWMDTPRTEQVDGREVESADDLEIAGLDYTAEPGVDVADVRHTAAPANPGETAPAQLFFESAPEAVVSLSPDTPAPAAEPGPSLPSPAPGGALEEKGAQALKSGKAAAAQTKAASHADPGYQGDKMPRYALDTKAQAKAAWSYINQKDNAAKYTANQLKRIKQRIVKALKKFGVEVNTAEHYLIEPAREVTESTPLTECLDYCDAPERGSFYVTLTNGPVTVSVSSCRVDPADLDLIGRAAMDGACKALATLDPDMDGDMDVPGAPAEDADRDLEDADGAREQPSANIPGMSCPCGCGCAIPVTAGACPCDCECTVCDGAPGEEKTPQSPAALAESAPTEPATAPGTEPTTAPDPVADPIPETEAPDVSEPTTPAVETSPATAPEPSPVEALSAKFDKLTDAISGLVSSFAAAQQAPPAVEAAPAPPAPLAEQAAPAAACAPAAPPAVAETQEQMLARMIAESQRSLVQTLAESGMLGARKGLTAQAPGSQAPAHPLAEGANSFGMPAGAPDKPLHQYSTEELNRWAGPMVFEHAVGHYARRTQ